ncbi:IclR family transcriptional regulator [Enterovirga aerilata]|uniref:IclR family transcriptional regulator n=1 Tax=Enterovirga aerilata TaxID=2730920 RepID=A0A849I4Z3_9HYPH|nr:IclR family transcriptional regulator [Enterovirga sp. DB1703]NNM72774.1 IclR family transcriptional regulator [Enterovirga sp. DB1703]
MIVRQAANVLDLLEFFARERRPATLSEIADHFGWPRSSTFNLLTTLADRGYLYEPKPRAGYYPTPRWLAQAQIVANAEPLPPWTKLILTELAADTGETVAIGGAAGTRAVFLDVVESKAFVRYFAQVGHRIPIHASSTGRALLLQYTVEERMALYRKIEFKQYGPKTPISIEMVEAELRRSIERGYCVSYADFSADLAGVAMPLGLPERRLAVVVAGPMFRMEKRIGEVAAALGRAIERHARGGGSGA